MTCSSLNLHNSICRRVSTAVNSLNLTSEVKKKTNPDDSQWYTVMVNSTISVCQSHLDKKKKATETIFVIADYYVGTIEHYRPTEPVNI